MRVSYAALLTLALAGSLACTTPDRPARTVSDSTQEHQLALHDSLRISLRQCIGCADSWKVAYSDSNLSVTDKGVRSDCDDCVGGSGDAFFLVRARRSGKGRVVFEYFGDTVVFRFAVW